MAKKAAKKSVYSCTTEHVDNKTIERVCKLLGIDSKPLVKLSITYEPGCGRERVTGKPVNPRWVLVTEASSH